MENYKDIELSDSFFEEIRSMNAELMKVNQQIKDLSIDPLKEKIEAIKRPDFSSFDLSIKVNVLGSSIKDYVDTQKPIFDSILEKEDLYSIDFLKTRFNLSWEGEDFFRDCKSSYIDSLETTEWREYRYEMDKCDLVPEWYLEYSLQEKGESFFLEFYRSFIHSEIEKGLAVKGEYNRLRNEIYSLLEDSSVPEYDYYFGAIPLVVCFLHFLDLVKNVQLIKRFRNEENHLLNFLIEKKWTKIEYCQSFISLGI